MDRLDAMALFVSAVDEGSLAAAARAHGRSPAAVTRAVALLEDQAGDALLLRSTRKLSLTSAGERHLAVWREVLAKLREVGPDGAGAPLSGTIVLTAPELFGRLKLMPLLEHFLRDHPQVAARAILSNRIVNLIGEGVDLAIRLAPLPDPALTAIKVGEVRALLCASPAYLARAGSPAAVNELEQHECIGLEGEFQLWPFAAPGGSAKRTRSVRVQARLSVDNAAAAIDASLRGNGIICCRSYQVADHIAAGRLVRLLPASESPPVPAHIIFPADRAKNGAVRAFIDHAGPALREELLATERMISGIRP